MLVDRDLLLMRNVVVTTVVGIDVHWLPLWVNLTHPVERFRIFGAANDCELQRATIVGHEVDFNLVVKSRVACLFCDQSSVLAANHQMVVLNPALSKLCHC